MNAPDNASAIPAEMLDKLRAIQRHDRRVRLQTALTRACAVLLTAMLLMMAVDWLATPRPGPWRWIMTLSALACGAAALLLGCIIPFLRPRSLSSVAQQVDRALPALQERCQTVTEFAQSKDQPEIRGSEGMIRKVARQTAGLSGAIVPSAVVSKQGLFRAAKFFAAAAGVFALFFLVDFPRAKVLAQRFLQPGADITLTRLESKSGDLDIGKGENVTLEFIATGKPANSAKLFLHSVHGPDEIVPLDKVPKESTAAASKFLYTANAVTASFDYSARSGDGQSALHHVTVLERPALAQVQFQIEAPAYSRLPLVSEKSLPRQVRALEGSKLEISFIPNQDLDTLQLKFADGTLLPLQKSADKSWHFNTVLSNTLSFEPVLTNLRHLDNQSRPDCQIIVYQDQPPTVNITSPSDDITARPDDKIQIQFEARDDFGIASAELVVTVQNENGSNAPPVTFPIPLGTNEAGSRRIRKEVDLDLAQFNLTQDQQLNYSVRVADTKNDSSFSTPRPDAGAPTEAQNSQNASARNLGARPDDSQNQGQQNSGPNQARSNTAENQSEPGAAQNQLQTNNGQNQSHPGLAQNQSGQNSGQNQAQPNNGQNQSQPGIAQNQSGQNNAQNQSGQNSGQNQAQPNNGQNQSQPDIAQNQSGQNSAGNQPQQNNGQSRQPNTARIQSGRNSGQNQSGQNTAQNQSQQNNGQNQSQQNSGQNQSGQEAAQNQSPDNQNQNPNQNSPSNNTSKRSLDVPGQTASAQPMRIKVDDFGPSFAGQMRQKQEMAIEPILKQLEQWLHRAHDLTETNLLAAQSKAGLGVEQTWALEESKDQLLQADRAVVDLKKQSAGTPYAFIGLQVSDIADMHITPASEELGEVTLDSAKAAADRDNLSQAAFHILQARKMLADLSKTYDSVKRDNQLADAMQELKKMHQIFLEDTQAMLGSKKPPINSTPRTTAEVNDDYVAKLNQLMEEQKKILADLAKILADDPRMLRRFMALQEMDATTLRDQMTLLARRQQSLTKQTAQWTVADETNRSALASQYLGSQASEQADVASLAAKMHENMITWLPDGVQQDQEPVATALSLAAQAARLASIAASQAAPDNLSNSLNSARLALDQFRLLHDYLPGIADDADAKNLSVYAANRLNEAADLVTKQSGWIKKMESLRDTNFPQAVEVDQHRLALDTTTLSEKLDAAVPAYSALSPEIQAKSDQLLHTVEKQLLPQQTRAGDALARNALKDAVSRQEDATASFAQAETQFDELLRLLAAKLDSAPPPDDPGENPALDQMLAMLKEEQKAAESLGLPSRPLNVQMMTDWLRQNSGSQQAGSQGQGGRESQSRNAQARAAQQRAREGSQRSQRATDQARDSARNRALSLTQGGASVGNSNEGGPKSPSNAWNTLVSKLGDELRQGRDNVPPEQYRQAIEQYFNSISQTVPAPAPAPAPDAHPASP